MYLKKEFIPLESIRILRYPTSLKPLSFLPAFQEPRSGLVYIFLLARLSSSSLTSGPWTNSWNFPKSIHLAAPVIRTLLLLFHSFGIYILRFVPQGSSLHNSCEIAKKLQWTTSAMDLLEWQVLAFPIHADIDGFVQNNGQCVKEFGFEMSKEF